MRGLILWGLGAGLLCACGSAGGQQNQAAAQPAPPAAQGSPSSNWATPIAPTSEAAETPVAPASGDAPPVTSQWLSGRWAMAGGACTSAETVFSFGQDGRYSLGSEQGRWSLAGTALTIQITQAEDGGVSAGERHTSEIAAVDANTAELRNANVPPVRLQRCR